MVRAASSRVEPANAAATTDGMWRRDKTRERLLAWYATEGRTHLPWRHTRDPYAVLVSEVMLQQTQVERVLPKYREFLACFPTLCALAEAPTAEVIQAWSSLGYNLRAVRLQQIAQQVVRECGGSLPGTLDGLLGLKGIGRYTAGAVACFAFGLTAATVDTNIRRVLWRVFRGIEPGVWPTGTPASRELLALAEWALPAARAYDWQQALMDLGATVCLSRRPHCARCPLVDCCAAYAETARATLFPSGEALARLRDDRMASVSSAAEAPRDGRRIAEQRAAYSATGNESDTSDTRSRKQRAGKARQEPFAGSSRYYRGRIVEALRGLAAGDWLTLDQLGPRVKDAYAADDAAWLRTLLRGLARDGLVRCDGLEGIPERAALP
jgi:A/G-specific adenine glycosylase